MMPAVLYIDPMLFGYMLEPLLRSQEHNQVQQYAALHLGPAYPNATDPLTVHNECVEGTYLNSFPIDVAHFCFSV